MKDICIKLKNQEYNLSKCIGHLFSCGSDEERNASAKMAFEQLKMQDGFELMFFSAEPSKYGCAEVQGITEDAFAGVEAEMKHRFDTIIGSMSRNYIEHNEKKPDEKIKNIIVIIDGIDTLEKTKETTKFKKDVLFVAQRCRATGIAIILFVNKKSRAKLYHQFPIQEKIK
jgi:hypothetical protein